MSVLPAPFLFFIVFLRVQSMDLGHARSSLLPFDPPEVDGFAVDTCRIFPVAEPTPITRKPTVESPPRKPEAKNAGAAIRPAPAPTGPITNSHSNLMENLLNYLLANSRRQAAGSPPGFNRFPSQPIRGLRHRGSSSSDSDELASTGRRAGMRRKIGSLSSSDES